MTSAPVAGSEVVDLFVVGAHLEGQPLSWQLSDRGATLVAETRTAAAYRLVALPVRPPKPGLVRVAEGGRSIEGERWRLPVEGFGALVAGVPSPLAIGKVLLEEGSLVPGFLCESWAAAGAPDISGHGGWRAYLAAASQEA